MPEKEERYSIKPVDRVVMFYLPAAKVWSNNNGLEKMIDNFLMKISNDCTHGLSENPHFGHWKDGGRGFREQHIEYTVAIKDGNCVLRIEQFLAKVANIVGERRIYMMPGYGKWVVPK